MLFRTATGLLVLALLWATFGCGGNQQGSGEQEPAQTEASTTPAKTTPGNPEVAVGQNAQLRDRTLIVNEVERNYTPTNRFPRPQSGNEFVRVNVSVTNNAVTP